MNNKKVAFHNLGCKVNSYELDAMTELLVNKGYEMVSFDDMADIYIVNTCSVTNIADRKSRQMLSRARHKNPDAVIVAVGCYVDTCDEDKLKTEGIDLCIGNNRKGRIVSILDEYLAGRTDKNCDVVKADDKDTLYETLHISESAEHSRAFIKIQDGCNQFCSYCIIPYARGRARSRKPEDIIDEIKGLVTRGYREFVINGIHISSYGADFIYEKSKADQFNPDALLDLLDRINNIEGVYRIRLGSLEPRIVTDDFIKRLSGMDKICGHFHLSLQSGCDRTLERMNRHYNADQYAGGVEIIRKYFEHPAITTDIIVGFPGETEEDFAECKAFAERIGFSKIHIFKYSRRKGTVADKMPDQLTDKEKSVRSDELTVIDDKYMNEFREWYVGRDEEILIEEEKEIDGEIYSVGHTKEYVRVAVPGRYRANELVGVRILGILNREYMIGKKI